MPWVALLTVWYVLIDDAYQRLQRRHGGWRRRGPQPTFSDSEVLTVALFCDLLFGGDEAKALHCLRQHHADLFPKLPANSRFNTRRAWLADLSEQVRQELSRMHALVPAGDRVRLLDSAPITLCTYQRGGQSESVAQAAAHINDGCFCLRDFVGYSAKDKARFMGLRLHLTATLEGQIDQWLLLPAGCHDSVALQDLVADEREMTFLADNAYRVPKLSERWRIVRNTRVLAPPRRNSRMPWPEAAKAWLGRLRRRIESVFSILASTFHLERPGSRSFVGCLCRLSTQILGYTLCSIVARLEQAEPLVETQN
jgi:hypothetical protein